MIHFPLHPQTPEEGITLEELFPGSDLTPMKENMGKLMREAGLAYGNRSHTYNSRLAQELGKWADSQPNGEVIHNSIYEAYFVRNLNIGKTSVLVKIAGEVGLDPNSAKKILDNRDLKKSVDKDWALSREMGITGVPTFYSNELTLVGCQPYETLEKFVNHLIKLSPEINFD